MPFILFIISYIIAAFDLGDVHPGVAANQAVRAAAPKPQRQSCSVATLFLKSQREKKVEKMKRRLVKFRRQTFLSSNFLQRRRQSRQPRPITAAGDGEEGRGRGSDRDAFPVFTNQNN